MLIFAVLVPVIHRVVRPLVVLRLLGWDVLSKYAKRTLERAITAEFCSCKYMLAWILIDIRKVKATVSSLLSHSKYWRKTSIGQFTTASIITYSETIEQQQLDCWRNGTDSR